MGKWFKSVLSLILAAAMLMALAACAQEQPDRDKDDKKKKRDKRAVAEVVELIDAIGTVTLESGEAIEAAQSAYDALPERLREKVTNFDALCQAQTDYADLLAWDAICKRWEIDCYVDEFGDETDGTYIRGTFGDGTFSNSATAGSELTALVFYHYPKEPYSTVHLRLLEYGSNLASYFLYGDRAVTIRVKVGEREAKTRISEDSSVLDEAYLRDSDLILQPDSEVYSLIVGALETGEDVKVAIRVGTPTDTASEYHFTITAAGFAEILEAYYE